MNNHRIAQIITKILFTEGGSNKCVDRLVLFNNDGREFGGWCQIGVRCQVEKVLNRHYPVFAKSKPKKKTI